MDSASGLRAPSSAFAELPPPQPPVLPQALLGKAKKDVPNISIHIKGHTYWHSAWGKKTADSRKSDSLASNCAQAGTNIVKLSEKQASGAWGVRDSTGGRP